MKRVFPVALTLALLVFGMAALADKQAGEKAPAAAPAAMQAQAAAPHDAHVMKMSGLTWKPMDGYPAGSMITEVCAEGGAGSVYAKFPAGTKVAPHTHPGAHWGTVVSGTATMGFGTDPAKGTEIGPGDYFHIPAKAVHWVNIKTDAVVFIAATGEPGIAYVNPADDPRKAKAAGEEHPK